MSVLSSIKSKLIAVISLIVSLTIVVGMVAIFSFHYFGTTMRTLISENLPSINQANELAVMAHDITAATPSLVLSANQKILDSNFKRISARVEELIKLSATLHNVHKSHNREKISIAIQEFEKLLQTLYSTQKKMHLLNKEQNTVLKQIENVYQDLMKRLQPIRDNTLIKLNLTLIEIIDIDDVDKAFDMQNQALNIDIPNFRSSLEICAIIEQAVSYLHQAVNTQNKLKLDEYAKNFALVIDELKFNLGNITSQSAVNDLSKRIKKLEQISFGEKGLFNIRNKQLNIISQSEQLHTKEQLLAANLTKYSSLLTSEIIKESHQKMLEMDKVRKQGYIVVIILSSFSAIV
ncbi:membrane or secreted protein, partial [Candidatus Magnetomorum sp. HK-1]